MLKKSILAASTALLFLASAHAATLTYTADTVTDFSNPERGLFVQSCFYGAGKQGNEVFDAAAFKGSVESNPTGHKSITLLRRYFCLQDFRNKDLDADTLGQIAADFTTARALGIKLIPRFAYNEGPIGAADADEKTVLRHIRQLTPILRKNEDVIAYMETGFIGTWGECHHSTNGLTDDAGTTVPAAMGRILRAVLDAVPADRMVTMRYPGFTQQIFGRTRPIQENEAYDGSPYSRVGTFDDCFEAGYWDYGTYLKGGCTRTATLAYLSQDNLYTVEGGETCAFTPYASCENTLADLRALHWSALHAEYEQTVIKGWVNNGCMDMVAALGYRYRLVSSTLPDSARPGEKIGLQLAVANDGTAACYNPRGFEVVLRPQGGGADVVLPVEPSRKDGTDPRFWLPGGETLTASVNLGLPRGLAPGTYEVLLNLPDPKPALHGNPAYSIRLANQGGLWEASTGFNRLSQTLKIAP